MLGWLIFLALLFIVFILTVFIISFKEAWDQNKQERLLQEELRNNAAREFLSSASLHKPTHITPAAIELQIIEQMAQDFEDIGWTVWDKSVHYADGQIDRIRRATMEKHLKVLKYDSETGVAEIRGSSDNRYVVSGEKCSCGDYIHRRIPCKHMYFLSYYIGEKIEKEQEIRFSPTKANNNRIPTKPCFYNLDSETYHRSKECDSFTMTKTWDAITESEALDKGLTLCAHCQSTIAFIYPRGKVYHRTKFCSDSQSLPIQLSEAEAIEKGLHRCSKCWK